MKSRKKTKELTIAEEQERILKGIGSRIKALRIKQGHTSYEDFAYENDINRSQFGKYERGEDMRISSLVKVLIALDVSFKDFFADESFE